MTTTKEVILKIKLDMARTYGGTSGSLKTVTDEAKKAGNAVADIGKKGEKGLGDMSRGLRSLMDGLDKVEKKAKKTKDALDFGGGRPSGGGSSRGIAGTLAFGEGNLLGKFGLAGVGVTAAMAAGREAGSMFFNSRGASMYGGPLMKGSSPIYEWFDEKLRGTEYRQRQENWSLEDMGILVRQREGQFAAQQFGVTARNEMALAGLSQFATPQQRLDLLRSQTPNAAAYDSRAAKLSGYADSLAARQQSIAATHNRYIGAGKIPGFFNTDQTVADPTGNKKTIFDRLEKDRAATLTEQLNANQSLLGSLKEQAVIYQQIKTNLEAQRDATKEMAAARRGSLVSFGMMDPYQQKAALGVAQALKEGRALTPEQKAIGGQVPEIADYMQRVAGSSALQNPDYQEILRLVGRPGEAERFQKSLQGMPKLQPGELALDVFVRVDEEMLGKVIAQELKKVIAELEVNQRNQANRIAEGERLRVRRDRDSGAALGNAAPGQAP